MSGIHHFVPIEGAGEDPDPPGVFTMTFEGAGGDPPEVIDANFYNGVGPDNYGVTFAPDTELGWTVLNGDYEFNNVGNWPSSNTAILSFSDPFTDPPIYINYAAGFQGCSFWVSTNPKAMYWWVYSGENGTGVLIDSGSVEPQGGDEPFPLSYNRWTQVVPTMGVNIGKSIAFQGDPSGTFLQFIVDDVTIIPAV